MTFYAGHFYHGVCWRSSGPQTVQVRKSCSVNSVKSPPGSGSAWRDADPDPGGKKA